MQFKNANYFHSNKDSNQEKLKEFRFGTNLLKIQK